MEAATNPKKQNIFSKKFKILLIVVIIITSVFGAATAYYLAENYKENSADLKDTEEYEKTKTVNWASSNILVDDRLPEDYPLFYIVSPMMIENVQGSNVMAMYNDGTYMSELYTYESYDDFQNELITDIPYWEQIYKGYQEFKGIEGTQLVVSDMLPSDIRESYISQYDIEDFSTNTEVNMSASSQKIFYVFGVTYNDELTPSVHLYYSQQNGKTTIVSSKTTKEAVEKILNLLSKNMKDNSFTTN